jgi:phosphoglycolate phosphatase-like HAD superfamily hydrolase
VYVRGVLADSSLSLEDKMEAVLQHVSDSSDAEAQDVMAQIAAVQDQRAGTTDPQQATKLDQSYEQLQLRLQKCMERHDQMFTLMSNISQKFDGMAKVAIENLGRA